MPVDSTHEEYDEWKEEWDKCRDVIGGSRIIKKAGTKYLPRLSAGRPSDYEAYKHRAMFYPAASRTVQGLLGAIFRKSPTTVPQAGLDQFANISSLGMSLMDFASLVTREVIITGRYGIMVDAAPNETNRAYLVGYPTESIINWQTTNENGETELSLVVLEEVFWAEGSDRYEQEQRNRYRVLFLDDQGQYTVEVYEKADNVSEQDVLIESVVPTIRGKALDYIPFQFVNTVDSTQTIYKSPISDVADVNISHYLSSADIEHGRHWTALPTVVMTGDDGEEPFRVGSPEIMAVPNPDAKVKMLEYTGQGLRALETALSDKEKLMGVLGARLLEEPKRTVESFETHKLRKVGEDSILASIADSVSIGLTYALQWWSEFSNINKDVSIQLNKDFVSLKIPPQEMQTLMQLWQSGGISQDTFLYNLDRGEILPEGRTIDDEKALLEQNTSEAEVEDSEVNLEEE